MWWIMCVDLYRGPVSNPSEITLPTKGCGADLRSIAPGIPRQVVRRSVCPSTSAVRL